MVGDAGPQDRPHQGRRDRQECQRDHHGGRKGALRRCEEL